MCSVMPDSKTVIVARWLCDADALNHFDGGHRAVVGVNATAGIFVTFPQPYLTTLAGFVDQVGQTRSSQRLLLNFYHFSAHCFVTVCCNWAHSMGP